MTKAQKLEWMMDQIAAGKARAERTEYCINGLCYSRYNRDWSDVYDTIHYTRSKGDES